MRRRLAALAAAGETRWMEYAEPADLATMQAAVARGPLRVD
jgi:hypothetical protein